MRLSHLQDVAHSGLYTLPTEHVDSLTRSIPTDFVFHKIRFDACANAEAVLLRFGEALAFPDWYGANFDALNDCLTDPDWQPAAGHVILLRGLASLRHADPEGFATLIEVLQAAAEERRAGGHPFWLLLDIPARGVPAFPCA